MPTWCMNRIFPTTVLCGKAKSQRKSATGEAPFLWGLTTSYLRYVFVLGVHMITTLVPLTAPYTKGLGCYHYFHGNLRQKNGLLRFYQTQVNQGS